jgi:hypothetical protein
LWNWKLDSFSAFHLQFLIVFDASLKAKKSAGGIFWGSDAAIVGLVDNEDGEF